jgi:hypothetical protein
VRDYFFLPFFPPEDLTGEGEATGWEAPDLEVVSGVEEDSAAAISAAAAEALEAAGPRETGDDIPCEGG